VREVHLHWERAKILLKAILNTEIKEAFQASNSVGELLIKKSRTRNNKYMDSGVYHMICSECAKGRVGQTGRSFSARLREHIEAFRHKL
jgi:hypothetical protein